MHYGHIASDKGASICERSLLSFVIRVLILHTKRTFHLAIWSVNDSYFVNYGMIFASVALALFTKAIIIWKLTVKIG